MKNEGNYTLHIGNQQVNYLFTGNKNFIKLGFRHILYNNPRGAPYMGGLDRLFEVWDFGWEKIFLGLFKNIDMDNS